MCRGRACCGNDFSSICTWAKRERERGEPRTYRKLGIFSLDVNELSFFFTWVCARIKNITSACIWTLCTVEENIRRINVDAKSIYQKLDVK